MREINSPYKLVYWAYYNMVRDSLGLEIDFVPEADYEPDKLESFDWSVVQTAVARGYVKLSGVSPETYSKLFLYPIGTLVSSIRDNLDRVMVSSNKYVVDMDTLFDDFIPKGSHVAIDTLTMVMILLFVIENLSEVDYEVSIVNANTAVESSKTLYYFKSFGYLPISYDLTPMSVESLNTLLFIDTAKFKGYFNHKLIERQEKLNYAKDLGLVKGAIVFLYERNYMPSTSNKGSYKSKNPLIKSVRLARIKRVHEFGVDFEVFSLKSSIESLYWDFSSLSDEVQGMYVSFGEYIGNSLRRGSEKIRWDALGVQYMMNNDPSYSEFYFMTRLESIHPVEIVHFDDDFSFEYLNLSVQDAVYYLLLQYGVKFDESLYLSMYEVSNPEVIKESTRVSTERLEDYLGYKVIGGGV